MGIKISQLPVGNAEQNAVVPVTNASGTVTQKVKLKDIASLAADQSLNKSDNVEFANLKIDNNLLFKAAGDNTDTVYMTKQDTAGNVSVLQIFVGDDGGPANVNAYYPNAGSSSTDYVAIMSSNGGAHHLFGTDGKYYNAGGIVLQNDSKLSPGSFDNGTGGAGGASIVCTVGYELNWQGGRLKNTYDNGLTSAPIYVDSPMTVTPVTVQVGYSSTISVDAKYGDMFDITLTGNTTLANPTNPVNGKTLRFRITQDGTGNRTVTLGNKFNIPSSATSPLPWSTSPNKMDVLAATYHEGRDKWDVIAFVPGY